MGKVSFASFIAGVKGAVGDAVFQGGKAGYIIRENVIPNNPQSARQTTIRAFMASLSQGWGGDLTEAERNEWDLSAALPEWKQTDSFGKDFQLSGEQLYVKLNMVLLQMDSSVISTPPSPVVFDLLTDFAASAAAGTPAMTVSYNGTLTTNKRVMVEVSPQLSPGVMSRKTASFVFITSFSVASPADILSPYTDRFGALVAGRKIFLKLTQVDDTTGEKAVPVFVSVVVAA